MLFSTADPRSSIMPVARTYRPAARRFTALALLFALVGMFAAPNTAEAAKSKLTCSFIQKQCVKECSKQMDKGFCSVYCADKQAMCMQTGRWDGIQRHFENVRRR